MRGAREERAPLLHDHGHGNGLATARDLESSGHHVHVDLQAHSSFRSFMLFLSLSLHSVFEGLAIGLQSTDSKVRQSKSPDVNCDRSLFFFFLHFLNPHKLVKDHNGTSLLLRITPFVSIYLGKYRSGEVGVIFAEQVSVQSFRKLWQQNEPDLFLLIE